MYELHGVDDEGRPVFEPVDGTKRICRSDTYATLAINRDSYTVIDHAEMGEIVEAVLAQPNVRWETAGSLSGGRAVWCLTYLDEPIELPGDTTATMPYLAITNRHDGTGACAAGHRGPHRVREHVPSMKARVRTTMASSCRAGIVPGHSHDAEVAPFTATRDGRLRRLAG